MTRDTVKQFETLGVSTMPLSSSLAEEARVSQDQKREELVRAELVRLLYTNADVAVSVTVVVAPVLAYFEGRILNGHPKVGRRFRRGCRPCRVGLGRRQCSPLPEG